MSPSFVTRTHFSSLRWPRWGPLHLWSPIGCSPLKPRSAKTIVVSFCAITLNHAYCTRARARGGRGGERERERSLQLENETGKFDFYVYQIWKLLNFNFMFVFCCQERRKCKKKKKKSWVCSNISILKIEKLRKQRIVFNFFQFKC